MNGVHDMGGAHGFGEVPVDDDVRFHAEWERIVYGMDKAIRARGLNNIDEKRHAVERIDPATYLGSSYFERWLAALETNLLETGAVTADELDAARREVLTHDDPTAAVPERTDPELAAEIRSAFERPADYERPGAEPRFEPGEAVRVRNAHPEGHTRCPRYARRAEGEIESVHGNHVFPDANAHGEERAEPLYTVAFSARELWGPDAETPSDTICIDLWEPYLRPAEESDDE